MSRTGVACFAVVSVLCLAQLSVRADTKEERERLENCAEVAREVLDIPEGIPQDLLDKAECVIVIPSVKKLALGFGGSYGKGAMVCRGGSNFKGPWGAPAMMRLEGGSFGLQIGGSATDFILLVMNPKGADSLLKSKVKLGGDASVAAGPKGRSAEASTDALMTAEILTYSRSKGLFAGVSLAGSTLRQDSGANEDLYGREISARDIVLEGKVKTPREGVALIKVLEKHSPKNLSD
jgi:lipid-binding SYLF domain-containing protein